MSRSDGDNAAHRRRQIDTCLDPSGDAACWPNINDVITASPSYYSGDQWGSIRLCAVVGCEYLNGKPNMTVKDIALHRGPSKIPLYGIGTRGGLIIVMYPSVLKLVRFHHQGRLYRTIISFIFVLPPLESYQRLQIAKSI